MKIKTMIGAALAAVCILGTGMGTATAAPKSYKDITYPKMNDIQTPNVERITLPNGMKLFLLEDDSLPLINISARIRVESVFDPADKLGLAQMTGSVMRTGGTKAKTGDEIDEELESIAASVETSIGLTSGSAFMSVLKDDLDTGMAVLADVLMNPEFRQEKIDLAKVETRSAISRRNDDNQGIARREYAKLIYGAASPYARIEEYATIEAITREDMIAFHKKYYHPNNVMLAVWGDFDSAAMAKKIEAAFKNWKSNEIDFPEIPAVDYQFRPTVNLIPKEDATQSIVTMGHIGITLDNPDYFALIVMNRILGSGSFTNRLFRNVRSRQGLAYAVGGNLSANFDYPGTFFVFCMTKTGTTMQAINSMVDEVRGMTEAEVTDEELEQAKESFLNAFVFNFDTRSEVVNRLMTYDYYGFPEDFLQQTKTNVEQVTKADVLRVARKYLSPDEMQIQVLGNPAEFDAPLADLGQPVSEIDISIPEITEELPEATGADMAKGKEVIGKTVKAMGGEKALSAVKNYRLKASATVITPGGNLDVQVESVTVYPNQSASILKSPLFGEMTQVWAGDKGWVKSMQGTQDFGDSEKKDAMGGVFRDMIGLIRGASSGKYEVQYLGEGEVDGKKSHLLSVSDGAGNMVKVDVDAASSMLLRMSYRGSTMMGPAALEELYSSYRDVNGVQMPFKTVTLADGKEYLTSRVTEAEINVAVDESMFVK